MAASPGKNRLISACAGVAAVHQRIGVDEREILALPGGKNRVQITWRAIHRCPRNRGTSDEHTGIRVELNEGERARNSRRCWSGGKHAARKLKRAQILLAADAGIGDEAIADSISVGGSTVYRTKRRFVEGNLDLSTERRSASWSRPQAILQGDGVAGGDGLLEPTRRP